MRITVVPARSGSPAARGLPGGRERQTKAVGMGPSKQVGRRCPEAGQQPEDRLPADVNAFFPHGITIHVGDKVRFVPIGFHTVDLPAGGGAAAAADLARPARRSSGAVDAAGAPFWFNGQPARLQPAARCAGRFGKSRRYNGSRRPQRPAAGRKPKPMTVDVHEGRHLHVLLRHPPRHEGHRHASAQGRAGPVAPRPTRKALKRARSRRRCDRQGARERPGARRNTVDVGAAGQGRRRAASASSRRR